jgi:Holliday junction resolvasome RuvABC endonuclease subunit
MKKESQRIIGINPGTRYLGIAVVYGSELMDWRIKVLQGKWSEEKIRKAIRIVSDLIECYEPNILAIKKLHPSRSSKNLKLLVSKIKTLAGRKRIKVKSYSIYELERYFIEDEKLNKRNLADKVVAKYPMLVHEFNKEKSQKHSYYMRAIEAVALGMKIQSAIDS